MSKLSNLIIKTDNYSFLDSQPHIHFKYYEQVIRNASPSSFNQSGCLNILISLIHKAICVILLNKCMTIFEFRTKKKKARFGNVQDKWKSEVNLNIHFLPRTLIGKQCMLFVVPTGFDHQLSSNKLLGL